ncbi:MAG: ribonuclease P protein component [Actinomycetota bacterium]|nr:ribonuclease P protein component [Actinomycetota bacterium]
MIERCRHGSDFAALRRGRRVGGRVLWMLYAPDDALDHPRVAFAIGRRVGSAVERNLLRRRIQSVLRETDQDIPAGRYLFGARQRASTVTYSAAREDVLHFLDRAELSK